MNKFTMALPSTVIMAAMMVVASPASDANAAGRERFQCRDQRTGQDASATARFEQAGSRKKFSVEVEAARRGSFQAGDILRVEVDNVRIGRIKLVRTLRDFVGDLNFDTTAGPGDKADPFPPKFPKNVEAGTVVEAGPFRCALQRR
jgi:hypothetical protein